MKNILQKTNWNIRSIQVHLELPLITLIKSNNDKKLDKGYVEIKFHGDPASAKPDIYEFKTTLLDNGDPEELLLFIRKF